MPLCEIGLCPKGFYVVSEAGGLGSRDVAGRKGLHHVYQVASLDWFGQDREPLGVGGWINVFDKQDHPPGETGKRLSPGRAEPDRTFIDDDAGRGVCLGRSRDGRKQGMRFNREAFDFERELERTPEPGVGRHD
jgi:hypothetical protein